ncbi:MAG: class I SAM-dependent methyltransferase [Bryobacter sp.]|nr:class I SAM-dependent methyltransferase [Bryobacter sp.]
MKQVDYGIDQPDRVRSLGMVGLVLMGTGVGQFIALQNSLVGWPEIILSICLWLAILLFVGAGVMLWSSKVGKYGMAFSMIQDLQWNGSERVLDVGTGRGLVAVMAARKAPFGNVVGIDTWSQEHLSENSMEGAQENATLERVSDRVQFEEGEAMCLNFSQNSFDVVVSSLALHTIRKRSDRTKAVEEMIRVLRPGGQLAIMDILHTREYEEVFRKKEMKNIRRSPMKLLYCLPTRFVIAEKKLK